MLPLNLAGNGYLSPAGGYPLRLSAASDSVAAGLFPRAYTTATAVVAADTIWLAHLGIFIPPMFSGGSDLGVIAQSDLLITATKTPITVTLPTAIPALAAVPAGTIALSNSSAVVTGTETVFATDGSWVNYLIHVDGDVDSAG